ncbi:hypothetical protein N658DRAFT_489771 [Parathielavia hyrcaniae]|uniref:Uncharacterized protein n=1 Tax=Parathielavia hyrcaniae TaxID=113614 RepID=A0AAN6PS18_9PEZI|nr:hypothetical protein N658DRAFT_489771 [Parathielavia hyrcaniae]
MAAQARHGLGLFVILAAALFVVLPDTVSAKALAAADGQTGAPDYTCSALPERHHSADPDAHGRRRRLAVGGSGFIPSTCGWHRNAFHGTCTPGCPEGKVELAVDSAGASCARGFGSFCCDPPVNTLAGRSDPQVQSFRALVRAFLNYGVCSPLEFGISRKRQNAPYGNPTSHDWSAGERRYITPFQETWDQEIRDNGSHFPSFDSLADSLASIDTSTNNAVNYLDRKLCNQNVRASFDPIVCSKTTCSGSNACPARSKRWMAAVPDDITNEYFDVTAVTSGADFTTPENAGIDPTHWWQQAKNLDWRRGSNHGVDLFTGEEIASSAFVSFSQSTHQNVITGAGPVWGCTTVAVVSNLGAWTAHFWQGFFEDDARFQQRVLDFLGPGNPGEFYPGLSDYTGPGGAFDLARTSFLAVVIMTPQAYETRPTDGLTRPEIVSGFGPFYPTRVAAIQQRLDDIFGVADGTLNTIVHTYGSDQLIWDWVPTFTTDAAGLLDVHWSWVLDRSPRMVTAPYTGMMTIQRRATDVPGLRPAVRIFCGSSLEFIQQCYLLSRLFAL